MTTLNKLKTKIPNHHLVNRYLKQIEESWTYGRYYIGGQVPLYPSDIITYAIINDVSEKLFIGPHYITNSIEMASLERAQSDFIEFQDMMESYKRMVRYNGLLRALVFWISPARKRAAERVWHPNNLYISDGELVIKK